MEREELLKLGIKKLLDRSEAVQLLEFEPDVTADKKSVEESYEFWNGKDDKEPFKYVFRDQYSFDHEGTGFKIYINGQITLERDDEYGVEAHEPEIKVVEVETEGNEPVIISDKDMDDELKNLINQYSYSRNILIMEQAKNRTQEAILDFQEFQRETVEELLEFIHAHKSDQFISTYIEEKLNTAHLYGYNEAKYNK